ncbi:Transposable element Tc1 transposase [Anthophora plagiata]
MGRKSKNTSFDMRQLVIFHHEKGKSIRKIADLLNISKSTIWDIVRRYKNEDRIESIPQSGRKPILNIRDKRSIIRRIKCDPQISAPKLAAELNEHRGISVHPENIRRVLRSEGYNGRIARKKPYINAANRTKRLKFAKEYIAKDGEWWEDVIFADESKYNIYGNDGRIRVWRKSKEELNPRHLQPTVKHGGGSVMVWACISAHGVGELVFIDDILDKNRYLQILQNNLKKSADNMGLQNGIKFYQDNDPKHKSRIVQEFLLYTCKNILHPPPQSPDLNPIENLWDELDRRIRTTPINTKEELKRRLQEEWLRIGQDYLKKIICNMSTRLRHVIKHMGYPTKY